MNFLEEQIYALFKTFVSRALLYCSQMRSKELSSRFSSVEAQAKCFRAVDGYLGTVFGLFKFKPSAKQVMTALALLIEPYDTTTELF